ncbi:WD domain, G-beta repeat protein, partial [Opisthorchis viverrini]
MDDSEDLGHASYEDMDYVEECDDAEGRLVEPESDSELADSEGQRPCHDDAIKVLDGHKESVFCLASDPLGKYLVSGGQDHVAIVWEVETGAQVFTTEGHEDSVTCVAFSATGTYLATGDMAGGVHVWLRPETGQQPWMLIHSDTVGDLQWLCWWQPSSTCLTKPLPAVLASGDSDGLVVLRSISASTSKGTTKPVKYLAGSGAPASAATFYLPSINTDRPKLVVLYQNAELRLWDLKTQQPLASVQLDGRRDEPNVGGDPGESPTVFSLACPQPKPLYSQLKDRELLAIGGTGVIHVVVIRQTDPSDSSFIAKCISTIETGDDGSVESIDFSWTHPYLAYGTVEGTVGIVDTVKLRVRQKWTYTDQDGGSVSIICLRWSRAQPVFFTSSSNGEVVAWPGLSSGNEADLSGFAKAPEPLAVWRGHHAMVLDLALGDVVSTQPNVEKFIFSASDDTTVRIFPIEPSVLLRLIYFITDEIILIPLELFNRVLILVGTYCEDAL